MVTSEIRLLGVTIIGVHVIIRAITTVGSISIRSVSSNILLLIILITCWLYNDTIIKSQKTCSNVETAPHHKLHIGKIQLLFLSKKQELQKILLSFSSTKIK